MTAPDPADLTGTDRAPLHPGELWYDDGSPPASTTDRLLGLVILAPWAGAVWCWAWATIAAEALRAVRGR